MQSVLIKTIPGYERYMFHSNGDIWDNVKKEYKSGSLNKKGYCFIKLNGLNKGRHYWIALAFIQNPENKTEVHHIDGNPANNSVSNLMWVTREEHLLIHKDTWVEKIRSINTNGSRAIPIEMCTMDWEHEADFLSAIDAERQTQINHSNIAKVLKGKREYASSKDGKKHRFRYINKETGLGASGL